MTTPIHRRVLLAAVAAGSAFAAAGRARADAAEDQLRQDWPNLTRYAEDDRTLIAADAKIDCVMIGDSITEGWKSKRPGFFTGPIVCRGIGGQTTPQMLLRFRPDVVALKPKVVQIMGGTNDIASNTGPMTPAQTVDNILSMVELAKAAHIRPIVASIPPAANFHWRPELDTVRAIAVLNAELREHATQAGAVYADYYGVLTDGAGGMKPGYAYDGVHPTEAGYDVMEPVALAAIAKALGRRAYP